MSVHRPSTFLTSLFIEDQARVLCSFDTRLVHEATTLATTLAVLQILALYHDHCGSNCSGTL